MSYGKGAAVLVTRSVSYLLQGRDGEKLEPWGVDDMNHYAEVLAKVFSLFGLSSGDWAVIAEYGSSPVVLAASRLYTPWMNSGAADRLGVRVVSVDGTPRLAERAAYWASLVQAKVILARPEVIDAWSARPPGTVVQLRARRELMGDVSLGSTPDRSLVE